MKQHTRRSFWTDREKQIVRAREAAGDTPTQMLAHLPGRTLSGIYQIRVKLELARRVKQLLGGLSAFIIEKHAAEWSDSEIAYAWNSRQANPAARIHREAVSKRRRALGLPINRWTPRQRERVAAKTRQQLAAAGLPSLAALHQKVVQQRIKEMGWPDDLCYREAQILTAIWDRGPMTKREICAAVGARLREHSRQMLKGKGKNSYLGNLIRRGLLISHRRAAQTGRGRGCNVDIYSLPFTIQRINPNVQSQRQRGDDGSPVERQRPHHSTGNNAGTASGGNGPDEASPWLQSLRDAMGSSIKGEDLTAIMQAQVEKAKGGDMKAASFVMNQAHKLMGAEMKRPVSIVQNNHNYYDTPIDAHAEAPLQPDDERSKALAKLRSRARQGIPLTGHPGDQRMQPVSDEEEKEMRRKQQARETEEAGDPLRD